MKVRKCILWAHIMIKGPQPDSRPGHLHFLTVAQLTGNSMRREHSKWKLMKRIHRTPCVINQHAAKDVCGCGFYHISWTERGPTFTHSTCLCRCCGTSLYFLKGKRAAAVSRVCQSTEHSWWLHFKCCEIIMLLNR